MRACLGPVNTFRATAPDEALPRLARSRTGYRGSLPLHRDDLDYPGDGVSDGVRRRTRAVAEDGGDAHRRPARLRRARAQCEDVFVMLEGARHRDTPALLRFLVWSVAHHQADAARYEREARSARSALRAAVAAGWTAAQWFIACPHPMLLLVLADYPGSLSRTVDVQQWWGPYCRTAAAREHEQARRAQAETESLRAQAQPHPRGRRRTPGSAAPEKAMSH